MKKRTLQLHVSLICSLLFVAFLFLSNTVNATTYYVATNGNDSYVGTSVGTPFLTLKYALGKVVAGDTIYVRAGTYVNTSTISISKVGTSTSKYYLFVYPGDDRPILDFTGITLGSRGVTLSGSYWYIKGIRIRKAGDNGLNISGAYNTIEFCDFSENLDGGCQLGGGAHDNRIINCDSYLNADYIVGNSSYTGGNADGFSPKLDVGTNNYFYGCRAWLNSDDGWDGYIKPVDTDVSTIIENCWTWKNGYLKDGVTTTADMNGNGFKMGGNYMRHNFIIRNCLSFANKSKGFDQNHNLGSMTLYNCTGKSNGGNNFSISGDPLAVGKVLTVKNCISYEKSKVSLLSSAIVATNSWDSQFSVASTDFISIDTTGISAQRKADGSLPDINYMHLAIGSNLMNAGTDVGLPYNGAAPDLGCFETGNSATQYTLTTSVGVGTGTVSPLGATKLFSSNSISIAATPGTNYAFDKWTDGNGAALSTTNPYTVSMASGDLTVKANFVSLPQYTLTTSIASGSGSITPASGTLFYSGNSVSLTATPAANYTFVSWGGDASGASATTSIVMNADKNVTASFALVKRTLTLAVLPVSSGTITPASGLTYDHGTSVKLTGTPAAGYVFDKWTISGTTLSAYDTVTVTMDADKTITGNFKLNTGVGTINTTDDSFDVWYGTSNEIKLEFNLSNDAKVAIYLYNAQGALVSNTSAISYGTGSHAVDLTNKSLIPGVYLCKLLVNGKGITRKVVVY